jgi:hypothetical protein
MLPLLAVLALSLQPQPSRADVEFAPSNPCVKDQRDFCPTEKPRTKSFIECMQKHLDELDPACRKKMKVKEAKLEEEEAAEKKAHKACVDDFFRLCQGVPVDDVARHNCLLRHIRQLSPDCAVSFKRKRN